MTIEICEVAVHCPTCKIPLIRIPKPTADDIVVCPDCGAGGTFKQVVEEGGNLIGGFLPFGTLQELLRKSGYPGK
jgi:hypothetical protein